MQKKDGIPKGRASMWKTTRDKSNVDTKLGEEIEVGRAKLMRWRIRSSKDDKY